jgi:hypothetical protein
MKKFTSPIIAFLITVGTIGLFVFVRKPPVIPHNIQKQVNFAIFYPQVSSQASIQKTTFKYDPSLKQLSFIVNFSGRQITFAEQSSPDSFADDPNFYPKFIEKLNGYATFDSVDGRVDLTRPKEVKSQAAVMNSKGTLMFAKSNGDISEDNWKQLFNYMLFSKPN